MYKCIGDLSICVICFFFFKQKTAYEMRISDWSSDVCSSDLHVTAGIDVGRRIAGNSGLHALDRRGNHIARPYATRRFQLGVALARKRQTLVSCAIIVERHGATKSPGRKSPGNSSGVAGGQRVHGLCLRTIRRWEKHRGGEGWGSQGGARGRARNK